MTLPYWRMLNGANPETCRSSRVVERFFIMVIELKVYSVTERSVYVKAKRTQIQLVQI